MAKLTKKVDRSRPRPDISHPYPPDYRSSLAAPIPTPVPIEMQSRPSPTRSRSPSDPSVPLTASLRHEHDAEKQRSGQEERRDENGLLLPPGWTKEDEEAEREFMKQGMFDWKALMGWRYWIRKEWWGWYLAAIILGVLVALMTIFHDQIVEWLTPMTNWMKDLPAGWTIPIAILFVLSFPPLFGQEIVAVLVGVVWGLWIGFGIVAAGTFAGEFGNFYAFKYCLRSTAEKYEKKNMNYALMAHIVREGGFWIVFVSRLSAIPGHFTTAVFATCGTGIWVFSIATILTLPKQLVVVYLGVIFKEAGEGKQDSRSKIISAVVLVVGFLVTIYAAWYIYRQMHKARVVVWRYRRVAAKEKGLSTDPIMAESGGSKGYSEEEMEEVRSPILHDHHQQRHQSYQNPYGIRYQSRDNMSFYEVQDGPIMPPPERDIGYASQMGYGMPNATGSSETMFPTARPSGSYPPQYGQHELHRAPTNASSIYPEHQQQQQQRHARPGDEEYTSFPVPSPVGVAR